MLKHNLHLLPTDRQRQKRLLFAAVCHAIDAPRGMRQPCVTGRAVGLAGNQHALRGQNRHQLSPDPIRWTGLEVDGRIPPQNDVPRPMLHAGQQIGDLPVDLPAEGLDRPLMLPGRLEILAPHRGGDELQHRGIIKAQRGALNCVAAAVASQQVASLQQARFAQEDGHAVQFGACGTCGAPDSQPPVALGQCRQDLRARKSNTPGSRKNSVTPINSELTTSVTRLGFRSSSSRAAWVEWTFKALKQAGNRRSSG